MDGSKAAVRYRVKDDQKARLFQEIIRHDATTRKSLAASLRLRPNSVSDAVQELKEDGLILEEAETIEGRTGRPQWIIRPNLERFTAVSYYVEGRSLKCGLVHLGGKALALQSRALPQESSSEEIGEAMLDLFGSVRRAVPASSELIGIGVSLVGTVQPLTHLWVNTARWPHLKRLDLGRLFASASLPLTVRRSLDTELEYMLDLNPAYRQKNVALFHWGYGIGTAFAYGGKILSSSIGRFGEIGHTQILSGEGRPCLCGESGCIETEAALWALMPELKKVNSEIPDDEEEIMPFLSGEICRLPAMQRAADRIVSALSLYYKLFYPDVFLLTGPFFCVHEIYERITGGFAASLSEYAKGNVSFELIRDGFSGCLSGGVKHFFEQKLVGYLVARG